MKISIKRGEEIVSYEVESYGGTLLEFLQTIKQKQDKSLTFSSGCRSGVCGSCAVRVNEKEVLACSYKVQDNDVIEPLKNVPVIRDLVVDMEVAYQKNKLAKTYLETLAHNVTITNEDEKINEVQSDCILCGSCYSACPIFSVNEQYLGPFTLTRVWKYVSDKREIEPKQKIDIIQQNGVWDCTLCNECTLVCPQDISSKSDIEKLRSKSAMFGYTDPNFMNNFGGGFGFDSSFSF